MTDVGRMQADPAELAQGPPRAQIQVVPLRGLPVVAAVVVLVIASIAGNWLWALTFCHVVGGALWTAIDLFVGLIIGPILGAGSGAGQDGLHGPVHAEDGPAHAHPRPDDARGRVPAGAAGRATSRPTSPNHAWLVVSYCVVGVMAVIALGVLSPANITVLVEMRKTAPDGAVIALLMRRFVYTSGIIGVMQVATLIIMTRVASQ